MSRLGWIAVVFVTVSLYSSCTKDQAQRPLCMGISAGTNTYNLRVKEIMDNSCAMGGCHDAGSASGNVILDSYGPTKAAFQNKDALCTMTQQGGCLPMPQAAPKLADSLIRFVQCWAENGYTE